MTVPSDPITPGASFQPPAARTRPGTVTTAGYLLFGIALLSLVGLITSLASYSTIRDVYAQAYRGGPLENSANAIAIATVAFSIVTVLLFGVGTAVLAPFVLKGKQPARIIAWVLCGLVICCQGGGLVSLGFSGASFSRSGSTNGVDMQQVQKQLTESLPGWIHPVQVASGGLLVALAIAIVILLALPASNPFFRKQPEQWAPPAYPTV